MDYTCSERNCSENNLNNDISYSLYSVNQLKEEEHVEDSYNINENYNNNNNNKNNIFPICFDKANKELFNKKEFINQLNYIKSNDNDFEKNRYMITNLENKQKEEKEKMKLGKKDKNDKEKKKHTKFCDDNIRKKCKNLVLKYMLEFINKKIYNLYDGDIGQGIFIKKLLIINQSQKSNEKINFNINFLNMKIGQIFSVDITSRINYFPSSHNKELIDNLRNEKNQKIKNYFSKLFDLDFIQCLKHFRDEEHIELLEGLKCLNDIKDEIISKCDGNGLDYYLTLKYYIDNYEKILQRKFSKKANQKKLKI